MGEFSTFLLGFFLGFPAVSVLILLLCAASRDPVSPPPVDDSEQILPPDIVCLHGGPKTLNEQIVRGVTGEEEIHLGIVYRRRAGRAIYERDMAHPNRAYFSHIEWDGILQSDY